MVDNAVDFASARIAITARWSDTDVMIEIRDDGPGFTPDILLRVGEPYVTTRKAGREHGQDGSGLGLGLFIAKTLIERSGAQLALGNSAGPASGAVARIVWPRTVFEVEAADLQDVSAPLPLLDEAGALI